MVRRIRHLSAHVQHTGRGRVRASWQHLSRAATTAAEAAPTLLLHHPSFEQHSAGPSHPERPLRFSSCLSALQMRFPGNSSTQEVQWCADIPEVTDEQIARVHTPAYVLQMRQVLDQVHLLASRLPTSYISPVHITATCKCNMSAWTLVRLHKIRLPSIGRCTLTATRPLVPGHARRCSVRCLPSSNNQ